MAPPGGYALAVVDPPWTFKVRSEKGITKKGAGGQYRTMTLDDIKAMPMRSIMARHSWLILWATNPMIRLAFDVLDAWGATFSTMGHWSKRNPKSGKLAFGTGNVLRCAGEPFLIARFGQPRVMARNIRSVIEGPRRQHSRKPDEAMAEFARLAPEFAPKIEVFARDARPGWDVFGDEVGHFQQGERT